MKIVAPPQITDLEGLLQLVTNPQKGIAYLQQLQAMRDNIAEMLSTYDTREKADQLLTQAESKLREAEALKGSAQQLVEKAEADRASSTTQLANEQRTWQTVRSAQQQDLAIRERSCHLQQQALEAMSAELTVREAALSSKQDALEQLKIMLDTEQEKMRQRKALLAEII